MIFIHGGYWRSMDKDVHAFPALGFVPDGIALASINYTLAPAADMDEIVRECRAAVAWCRREAAALGIDPDRIHVSGHSAGGHLTAMMLATDWPSFGADLPGGLVKSGCPISGLYDLEPIALTYLTAEVRLTDALVARNSPVRLAPHADIETVDMPGRHHFDVVTALAEPDSALYRAAKRRIVGAAPG